MFNFFRRTSFNSEKPLQENIPTENLAATNPINTLDADYSSRANGDTYIDRAGESASIFDRINISSSSVIGISGVRGAGKSSLALKVLNNCKERDYFTILIASPTAYDSKEFLLTIYQTIAEKVRFDLSKKIRITLDATQENKELLKKNRLRKIGTYFLLWVVAAMALICIYNLIFIENHIRVTENNKALFKNGLLRDTDRQDHIKSDSIILVNYDKIIAEYSGKLTFSNLFSYGFSGAGSNDINMSFVFLIVFIILGLLFVTRLVLRNLNRTAWQLIHYPNETAIYRLAQKKLEWLSFQSKVSSSNELNIPVASVSGKISKSKELQERPMSLPGLTADFNSFIDNIASIYNDKVVICIDELDKIGTFTEIETLLKGIKGIIGQNHTHFLLTISEDALLRFTSRLRKQRDIMESSFEEILVLNRVDKRVTREMIQPIFGSAVLENDFEPKTMLLWLFSNGIPREIKRTIILLRNDKFDIVKNETFSLFFSLWSESAASAKSWALMDENKEYETNRLLVLLEHLTLAIPADMPKSDKLITWYESQIATFKYLFPESNIFIAASKDNEEGNVYDRLLLELFVRILSIYLLTLSVRSQREYAARLMYIIDVLPYNTFYAAAKFQRLLKDLGIKIPEVPVEEPKLNISL